MGWSVKYQEYEIYPSIVPVREGSRGIVGFTPVANVFRVGEHDRPMVELGPPDDVSFLEATAAVTYIVKRAKGLIDGDESALQG